MLSKDEIIAALSRLGELAAAEGQRVQLVLVGGAAMALGYNARPSTRDVDALFLAPPDTAQTRHWASIVASEFDWPDNWLNDGAKGFMRGLREGAVLLETPGIRVVQVAHEQLLAMKLGAWRDDTDVQDARRVLSEMNCGALEEVWNLVEPFVMPGSELKARYALEDLWEGTRGTV